MNTTFNNVIFSQIDSSEGTNSRIPETINMTAPASVNVVFKGDSRSIELPSPSTLTGLQEAFVKAFSLDFPSRSVADEGSKVVSFTYRDPDGDEVVFDTDSELRLAMKLCPGTLEITAAVASGHNEKLEKTPAKTNQHPDKIYRVAARNLREYNGVPSMTSDKLKKTLDLLELSPRRLVRQGLAPRKLLLSSSQRIAATDEKHDDFAEAAAADTEVMSDKKEYLDGFVDVSSHNDNDEVPAAVAPDTSHTSESSSDDSEDSDEPKPKPEMPLHAAFITAGIEIRLREVRPLLLALGVRPPRFVKLGLVDADAIPRGPPGRGPWGPHGKPWERMHGPYPMSMLFGPPPPPFAHGHPSLAGRRGPHGPHGPHGRHGVRGPRGPHGFGGPHGDEGPHGVEGPHGRGGPRGFRVMHIVHRLLYGPPPPHIAGGRHPVDHPLPPMHTAGERSSCDRRGCGVGGKAMST